jgi:colanic acid/amylovoran biosynthesis glycosyltransferase
MTQPPPRRTGPAPGPKNPGDAPPPAAGAGRPARVAYVMPIYPMPSLSFIRREIAALEAQGFVVVRFSLRRSDFPVVDPRDAAEAAATRALLDAGPLGMAWAALALFLGGPGRFLRALAAAIGFGRRSNRGLFHYLIYFLEACVLARWCAADGVEHVHAHFGTNSADCAMLARMMGGPGYSFTVHGPDEFDRSESLSLDAKIRHAAFAVGISQFGRSQLCRWSAPRDWPKIRIVRCGLDDAFLGVDGGPPPDVPRFVSVGRLDAQKGQVILVEAVALLKRRGVAVEVVLVGDGVLRPELEALIGREGLEGSVTLAGWRGGDAIRDLILGSRAMALPSFAEGLPVVLMESLALGRPAISTYVAAIPELIAPGVNGWLIPAGSAEALADALADALATPVAELAEMGRAGAALVAANHDAATEAARLGALFRRAIAGLPAEAPLPPI